MQQLIESWQDFSQWEFKDTDFGDNVEMKLAAYWHVLQTGKEGTKGNKRIRKYARVAAVITIDARATNEKGRIQRKMKNLLLSYMRRKVI